MESNPQFGDDRELDRLLGQAQWPEPCAEQIARLADHWRRIVRRRRMRLACGALAAASLLAVGMGVWQFRGAGVPPEANVVVKNPPETSDVAVDPPRDDDREQSQAPTIESPAALPQIVSDPVNRASAPRDANLYEQVLLGVASPQSVQPRPPQAKAPRHKQTVEEAVEQLVAAFAEDAEADANADAGTSPKADVDGKTVASVTESMARVRREAGRCERMLWAIVSQGKGERRMGAARLLTRIATPQSLGVLVDLMKEDGIGSIAAEALGRLTNTGDLARLAGAARESILRQHLLELLLERRNGEAIGLYLGFVNHGGMRDDALAAVAQMDDPPTDLLLAYLENPQRSVRLAAAQALARVADPEVAVRLSGPVLDGVGRQEALVALLLSRNEQATGVLNAARQNLYLVASVRAAEQELHSLIIRGGNLP